jgi:UDP-glucose 4-epimerase
VLVTGGAGFIGAHLVRALVARGDAVRVLDNFVTGTAANLALALGMERAGAERALSDHGGKGVPLTDRCEVVVGDIRDPAVLAAACAGVEVIFHQAALRSVPRSMAHPQETHDVNATGTLQVLQQARANGVRRVVAASSSAVYGDTALPKHEGQVPQPKSPYAASKLAGEAYCATYSRGFGLPTVALRYFNVFGPWQDPASEYAAVIPKFIRLALRGEPLPVHGDGMQSRDFTYVDNVVEANLLAAESDAAGVALNVGAGARYTLLDLIEHLQGILGWPLAVVHEPPRPGDVRHTQADIALAGRLIGYAPRVDFAAGLARMVESMRQMEGVSIRDA